MCKILVSQWWLESIKDQPFLLFFGYGHHCTQPAAECTLDDTLCWWRLATLAREMLQQQLEAWNDCLTRFELNIKNRVFGDYSYSWNAPIGKVMAALAAMWEPGWMQWQKLLVYCMIEKCWSILNSKSISQSSDLLHYIALNVGLQQQISKDTSMPWKMHALLHYGCFLTWPRHQWQHATSIWCVNDNRKKWEKAGCVGLDTSSE